MQSWNPPTPGSLVSSARAAGGLAPAPADSDAGPVLVHDTATDSLAPVEPADGTARLYVCGITPYDATHLGHANTYLAFDLLQRQWRDAGLDVRYVQNITDVDDPLLERATATGVAWQDLAEDQIELFRTDMAALRVLPPDVYAGAVESIDLVVDLVEQLREQGSVYQLEEGEPDWYFRCSADDDFGSVSGWTREQMMPIFAERGGDPDRAGKVDPFDCLVWLQQRAGEPGWESALGTGRPGWHIECTAIARQHLGDAFDVQGGGSDLIFPHHEMCASQARTVNGAELARAYVHGGMVGLDGEKMSKSRGNLVLVSQLRRDGADPMAIRLALLSQHYRNDWSWTPHLLTEAGERLDRWRDAVRAGTGAPAAETVRTVRRALRHDLDAPAALAAVDAWVDAEGSDPEAPGQVADLVEAVLGVDLS
ncbi:MAG TPA: cysteine--1-D-myo-inosityl 2-amino-2-deoxy-alpha-D-glucopyranoside ligase [Candidatus Avipropionibacterium avicola]|uniref:L-cysteine:1D-myo-inositol 2-amino-2-deoxy-alpha-D-glucopyranoside ligase n=1 Tax=Candidatus Avipropionibacterium avicola TaxID=2840701 RepID=A0A9D1GVP4_9ACTN|nr:cysteine--1-D-myo-inosityl 2-amino-2-deoxy-alpha-D-glucopyranoside ligase [Candidatus Avipropionibacterium avicola]